MSIEEGRLAYFVYMTPWRRRGWFVRRGGWRRSFGALATEKLGEETKKVLQGLWNTWNPQGLCGVEDGGV
jgi:hypothetical protein